MHVKITQKMDPAIKKAWVDALRSDEFVQGTGELHPLYAVIPEDPDPQTLDNEADSVPCENAFCCLGVLTELHRRAVNPDKQWSASRYHAENNVWIERDPVYDPVYDPEASDLPYEVAAWAGMSPEELMAAHGVNSGVISPVVIYNGRTTDAHNNPIDLAALNDGVSLTDPKTGDRTEPQRLSFAEIADIIEEQL